MGRSLVDGWYDNRREKVSLTRRREKVSLTRRTRTQGVKVPFPLDIPHLTYTTSLVKFLLTGKQKPSALILRKGKVKELTKSLHHYQAGTLGTEPEPRPQVSVSDPGPKLKSERSGTAAAKLVCKAPPAGGRGTFQRDDSHFLSPTPGGPTPTTCARPSSNLFS